MWQQFFSRINVSYTVVVEEKSDNEKKKFLFKNTEKNVTDELVSVLDYMECKFGA